MPLVERGLRLRLRYEFLSADVPEDPDPWEPDADDMEAVEERICERSSSGCAPPTTGKGLPTSTLCSNCAYRSICRDSAARGEPAWPVLVTEGEGFADR